MSTDTAGDRVAVIIGSTRPTRICREIAEWTRRTLGEHSPLQYQLVDLAEINLPFLDEPLKAALQDYKHAHTKTWSSLISSYAGFLFVFPQYNWGYPAVLKNAVDYLYAEWHDKPATTVTYGSRGGGLAADQLHQVFDGLHMRPLKDRVEVKITDDQVDRNWQLKNLDATMNPHRAQLRVIDDQMAHACAPPPNADVARQEASGSPLRDPSAIRRARLSG